MIRELQRKGRRGPVSAIAKPGSAFIDANIDRLDIVAAQIVTSNQLLQRVKEIISTTFNVSASAIPDDLQYRGIDEWDSVGHMDLLVALEAAFAFGLDTKLIARLSSIPAITEYLEVHLGVDQDH